jgi:hypothetical protein
MSGRESAATSQQGLAARLLKMAIYRHHRHGRRSGSGGMIVNLELAVALYGMARCVRFLQEC